MIDTDSPDVESVEVVKTRIKRGVEVFGDDMWSIRIVDCAFRREKSRFANLKC